MKNKQEEKCQIVIFLSHIRQMRFYSAESLELSKQIYSQQNYLKDFYLFIIQLLINFLKIMQFFM